MTCHPDGERNPRDLLPSGWPPPRSPALADDTGRHWADPLARSALPADVRTLN